MLFPNACGTRTLKRRRITLVLPRSLVAVDGEVATVVSTRSGPNGTCVLALRRDGAAPTGGRRARPAAPPPSRPRFLDGGVLDGGRDCLYAPPQYAFDYASPAAAACVARYAARDQALGLDGRGTTTWARTSTARATPTAPRSTRRSCGPPFARARGCGESARACLRTAFAGHDERRRNATAAKFKLCKLERSAAAQRARGSPPRARGGQRHGALRQRPQAALLLARGRRSAKYPPRALKDRAARDAARSATLEADLRDAAWAVATHAPPAPFAVPRRRKLRARAGRPSPRSTSADGDVHGWALAYWASFLLAVRDPSGPLALGVHPFHRGTTGTVAPWLHPVLFLDVGAPRETRDLLEAYRVPEHFTYRRVFDRGVALYNPSDLVDLDVPLGGAYVDPWDFRCGAADRVTLGPRSGAVLFDAALVAPDDRLGFWAAGGGLLAVVSAALRTRGGGAGKDA
ncbi:hypothetical protein SO694_00069191 [Aureococcus anophagefferens]|uniref:BEACH domain-containing protein n=1 Tax=Aureococcus anophagefferens TaxID=44056 RepID=A0ABR1FQ03_AURAN